jgi:RNA polymerase sigma-70 factor (ECF subfamily)
LELPDNFSNSSELVDFIRSGNAEAFRRLVELYQDKVIRTCMGFVHSYPDAEDIAQDVFVEIYLSISKFRGDSELSTWIYRIAVNKSLNFLRSASRRKILSLYESFTGDQEQLVHEIPSGNEYYPDEELLKSEKTRAINQAISKLPSNQKTAFILSKYDGLSNQEIAKVMNISVSSVESVIFRAKQNLRKQLFKFYKNI